MARTFVAASTQYLSVSSAILTGVPITFACWYNTATITTVSTMMSFGNTTTATNYFDMDMLATSKVRALCNGNVAASTASVVVSTWTHCVGVFASATSRTLYLNNVSSTNAVSATPSGMNISAIGILFNGSSTGINKANCMISFPAIWNVALSATDVGSLFSGASPRMIRPDHLVSYVRMTGGTSPEPDFVNGSTTWTLTGTPTESANTGIFHP